MEGDPEKHIVLQSLVSFMNVMKAFTISAIFLFIIWLIFGSGKDIPVGIVWAILLGGIVVGWIYAAFLLLDSGKWYYELFSIIMTGIFGIVILIGLRWGYRKMNLHFLD